MSEDGQKGTLPAVETVQSKKPTRKRAAAVAPADAPAPGAQEPRRFVVVKGERYELPTEFTGREFVWLQEQTGVRMGEIDEAAGAGDVSVLCALASIAVRRAGRDDVEFDDLLDLPIGNPDDGIDFVEEIPDPPTDGAGSPSSAG